MTTSAAHVLVVDDEPAIRELAAMVVASSGHEPVCVASVDDALAELDGSTVDLVVTDLNMPERGGLELLAALSARRGPPAIVISGSADESELRAARLLGARVVVEKPFGFSELRREIAAVLSPARLLATAA